MTDDRRGRNSLLSFLPTNPHSSSLSLVILRLPLFVQSITFLVLLLWLNTYFIMYYSFDVTNGQAEVKDKY